jgi:hypothetical protein
MSTEKKKNPARENPKKPKEGESSRAKPPIIRIPRRSIDNDKDVELAELVKRFGGTEKDWEIEDGFWVVKS